MVTLLPTFYRQAKQIRSTLRGSSAFKRVPHFNFEVHNFELRSGFVVEHFFLFTESSENGKTILPVVVRSS